MKQNEPFSVLYQDDDMIVVNKASGLLVAADRWDPDAPRLDLAVTKALFGDSDAEPVEASPTDAEPTQAPGEATQDADGDAEGDAEGEAVRESRGPARRHRIYAVHRIDKDTSGIVIYAKTEAAHRALSMAFEKREVHKTYHALAYGRPVWDETEVNEPLRADGDLKHRTVRDKRRGKESTTLLRNIGPCGKYCWIEAKPVTGRTHQIRVHLQLSGLPIACDPLYGDGQPLFLSAIKRSWRGDAFAERPLLDRLALHAWRIELAHPITGEPMVVTAPYPRDLESTRKQLKKIYKTDPLEGTEESADED